MINIGVIGYGYWGPNLVRNFAANRDCTMAMVADFSAERCTAAQTACPGLITCADPAELIASPEIEAVAIATPVDSHFELALAALQAGKHVLIEKPITSTPEQAEILIAEAAARKLVLLVDHTFVYTGAVRKIREQVLSPEFGDIRYYDSTRVNLGLFQHDVNVLWDLAVHDLSIMSYIIDAIPVAVSATGHGLPGQPEYVAFLTVFFPDLIGHINVNWLSPVKLRKTLIGGTNQMIVYDDLESSEKVKVYDKGITITESPEEVRKLRISYRTGDMRSPKLDESEALGREIAHFLACIRGEETPRTPGEAGLALVRILEAANRSMASRGAPVPLR